MGHWSIHIEGTGIHDNGKPGDVDALLREFVNRLAIAGQMTHSATLTLGSTRECFNPGEKGPNPTPLGYLSSPTEFRHR